MGRLVEREKQLRAMLPAERAEHDKGAQRWMDENREALEASNRWVEKNGLPLAKYRQF